MKKHNLGLIIIFLLAFTTRLAINKVHPNLHWIDLEIYRGGGEMIIRGVNPYNSESNILQRRLILNNIEHDLLKSNPARWNYVVSGNLPLNLLFFGLISAVNNSPQFYMVVFAFFDSLLSVTIYYFIDKHWKDKHKNLKIATGILLGCFSPVLLRWGTFLSEDKGIQILVMLLVIVTIYSNKKKTWLYFGSILLGLSIAFKGLGIFLVPIVFAGIIYRKDIQISGKIIFLLVTAFCSFVWFIPFTPDVFHMMSLRLRENNITFPEHGSIWVWIYHLVPSSWLLLRYITAGIMFLVSVFGYLRKKINIFVFSGTLLLAYTSVFMIGGSLDRMNIGILISLLFIGTQNPKIGYLLMLPYLLLGLASVISQSEYFEGMLAFIYVFSYICVILFMLINDKNKLKSLNWSFF